LKVLNAFRLIHIPSCTYYFAILNNILLSYLLRCICFYRASACEHVRGDYIDYLLTLVHVQGGPKK